MVRFGTCASRSPRSRTLSLSSVSGGERGHGDRHFLQGLLARRAVTVTASSVVGFFAAAWLRRRWRRPCFLRMRRHRQAKDQADGQTEMIALHVLPFRKRVDDRMAELHCSLGPARAVSHLYLGTVCRAAAHCRHFQRYDRWKERRHGLSDRAGRAVLPDVRRLSRLQRHPVRAGRGAGRRAADRPDAWSRRCSPACSWTRWSAS